VAITFRKTPSSDGGKQQTSLYRNLGNGQFEDVTKASGAGEMGGGMG